MLIFKKRFCLVFLSAVITMGNIGTHSYAQPSNSAHAAVLVNAATGELLFSQNADDRMLIASTTKIMTAMVALECCSPDEKVKIIEEYTKVEGSSIYFAAGDIYTVEELLCGLLLASGNDAALALAYHCAGSVDDFAQMMNNKAASLGLFNTCFKNPHGLDAEGHYSSAADLATITCEALKNELFSEIVASKTYNINGHSYRNHNKLLWQYDGCIGVKTGYTMAAGRSLVSCAIRDGLKLVCVTLSDPDDWNDHANLYDWAFSTFEYKSLLPLNNLWRVPVISGAVDSVGVEVAVETGELIRKDAKLSYKLQLPQFIYAGVKAGEVAGRVFVYLDGEEIGEYPLVYSSDVPLAENTGMTVWERIKKVWYLTNKYGFVFGSE